MNDRISYDRFDQLINSPKPEFTIYNQLCSKTMTTLDIVKIVSMRASTLPVNHILEADIAVPLIAAHVFAHLN